PVLIASSQGGVSIEDVAASSPEDIIYEPITITCGLTREKAFKIAHAVGLCEAACQITEMLLNMYKLFCEKDALLIEINPYAEDAIEGCKCY
ncbi:succinate--CoA ligase [ADP-forming] subunit beta, mitochondrial-like, partial [Condylostylus longicornis]|uniref:succinate--CoA ligase [ADP-forming] subunit beta, mitochondrial-like n=1 Tax=Condylostylus longicornis TaxID=2530218 RepID=UPI00244E4915